MFSIGILSKRTDTKVTTIRYYEKMGLIDEPSRSEGNQRQYSQAHLERLSFIRHARELGFTINDIRDLISLEAKNNRSCKKVHEIAKQNLQSIRQRMKKLKLLEAELKRIEAMTDNGRIDKCRVIQALADHSLCTSDH